jgi:ribosomal protein L24E
MTKAKVRRTIICDNCHAEFIPKTGHNPERRFCSKKCRETYWMIVRRETPPPKRNCAYCGKEFQPKRKGSVCCSGLCFVKYNHDIKNFGGSRRTAIGYDSGTCWICRKSGLKGRQLHVHHMLGRETAGDIMLVVLCRGCHLLAEELARRKMLKDADKIADLLTIARFRQGLPDARTVIIYEEQ